MLNKHIVSLKEDCDMQSIILVGIENFEERTRVVRIFREAGFRVIEAESGSATIALLRRNRRIGVALVDTRMADFRGVDFIHQIRVSGASLPLIAITAGGDSSEMQYLLQAGASDCLDINEKPARFIHSVSMVLRLVALEREVHFQRREGENNLHFYDVCGPSTPMSAACAEGRKAAETLSPVLIEGEVGSGRETFARIIHHEGAHAGGAFIRVFSNDEESDAEYGSLPDITKAFQRAQGGTLCFIDIDHLTINVQKQLLNRLVTNMQPEDNASAVRFMATCGASAHTLVRDNVLDSGLVAFFSAFHIIMPALRERRDDIPAIAEWTVKRMAANLGKENIVGIHSAATALLMQHSWPGNISELENILFRAVVLGRGPLLQLTDFPQLVRKSTQEEELDENISRFYPESHIDFFNENGHIRTMAEIEDAAIDAALKRYNGRMSEVARRLRISRSTLYRKLAIDPDS